MYKISTHIELPIAHCLNSAYSGLCCGNVYRDKTNDGEKDRYELGTEIYPILHGHNYFITVKLQTPKLNKDHMVIDFKLMKKIIHEHFDQYDHAMILTHGNPLIEAYRKNYADHGIDFDRSRLFVWSENPTAEYMAKVWAQELKNKFSKYINDLDIDIVVEETSHNAVTYSTSK